MDAGVDPDHIAVRQLAGALGGEGEVAVDRPGTVGPGGRHRLPDGVDAVLLGSQLDHGGGTGAQVGLGDAGAQQRPNVEHRLLVDAAPGGCRPARRRSCTAWPVPAHPRPARAGRRRGAGEGVGHLVATQPGAPGEEGRSSPARVAAPSSRSGTTAGCRWSDGSSAGAPSGYGVNRCGCSAPATTTATGRRSAARPLSQPGLGAGGVGDGAGAEQEEPVEALGGELVLELRVALGPHAGSSRPPQAPAVRRPSCPSRGQMTRVSDYPSRRRARRIGDEHGRPTNVGVR